ncbi:Dabb family protein [Rudanella paleaurantiibacter]|uniref:Dabb family protein n=1 Tax=Rudanella paleaurantiibacter TaxID=2614655 RepID=A0A7J5TWD9_9BACT|nr:Dabb family protein [Rudanella paleaurantiibacter]KAB7728762.1 Dabb family protein [Rudanella paleaurantiibacter]
MNRKSKGYLLIVAVFCAFGLFIYGAYSPARKALKQQIFCVKFKNSTEKEAVERHMHAFAALKRETKAIVNYSAGRTIEPAGRSNSYDVVHYLTFQSEEDMKNFQQSAPFKTFKAENEAAWENILVINADIQQ